MDNLRKILGYPIETSSGGGGVTFETYFFAWLLCLNIF